MGKRPSLRTKVAIDLIVAALRDGGTATVAELSDLMGWMTMAPSQYGAAWCEACQTSHEGERRWRWRSTNLYPGLLSLERAGLVERWRPTTDALWEWRLTDKVPPPPGDDLEALFEAPALGRDDP